MNDGEQEPNRLNSKKQPKDNSKGRGKKVIEDFDSDEAEDSDENAESINDDDDYDDDRSQKRFYRPEVNKFITLANSII